jgi:hypothetical protein
VTPPPLPLPMTETWSNLRQSFELRFYALVGSDRPLLAGRARKISERDHGKRGRAQTKNHDSDEATSKRREEAWTQSAALRPHIVIQRGCAFERAGASKREPSAKVIELTTTDAPTG